MLFRCNSDILYVLILINYLLFVSKYMHKKYFMTTFCTFSTNKTNKKTILIVNL